MFLNGKVGHLKLLEDMALLFIALSHSQSLKVTQSRG